MWIATNITSAKRSLGQKQERQFGTRTMRCVLSMQLEQSDQFSGPTKLLVIRYVDIRVHIENTLFNFSLVIIF